MNLIETILAASRNDGGPLQSAARQVGLEESDARVLLSNLVPKLAAGARSNAGSDSGLDSLVRALTSGGHERYLRDPAALQDTAAVDDGNAILGHLLGSKDRSRQVAGEAASVTGIDVGIIKRFLPLVAATTMGALSRETGAGRALAQKGSAGLLSRLLDSDGNGSIADNLLALGRRLF